ncbi:MAG: hypothetical protein ACRDTN_10855, partial [Mycobacterium sp.]
MMSRNHRTAHRVRRPSVGVGAVAGAVVAAAMISAGMPTVHADDAAQLFNEASQALGNAEQANAESLATLEAQGNYDQTSILGIQKGFLTDQNTLLNNFETIQADLPAADQDNGQILSAIQALTTDENQLTSAEQYLQT